MDENGAVVEKIRANAALVVSVARGELEKEIGYDEAGVRWLDGYIEGQREHGNPEDRGGLVNTLGSYLGECIIQSFGGEWAPSDSGWCVKFNDKNAAYPFNKVRKQLENGPEDSVLAFYSAIPTLFRLP